MISNRIILTDVDGRVLADNETALLNGQSLPIELETQAIPLEGKMGTIGKLVFVSEITPRLSRYFALQSRALLPGAGFWQPPLRFWLAFISLDTLPDPYFN